MSSKLVAYFSAGGTTAAKAKELAAAADAAIYEIRPAKPYTAAEIKWTNPLARCNREWIKKADVSLADTDAPVAACDVIYLAFPIWYYTAPLVIRSFLKSYDFSGKKIVLAATSGGSGFGKTAQQLRAFVPGAEIVEGAMLNGSDPAAIQSLAERF